MSELTYMLCVTHNPYLPSRFKSPEAQDDAGLVEAQAMWTACRRKLENVGADAFVVVANDHLNQQFMDNMPAFMIGSAGAARGPFDHEQQMWGLDKYDAPGAPKFANELLTYGLNAGVDFAFSNEYTLDHAFTMPMSFLAPSATTPIVPVFANVMAQPMPPAARFFKVGQVLRDAIESAGSVERVAVVFSGHLSVEVGGPRMDHMFTRGVVDRDFEVLVTGLIEKGDVDSLLRVATNERLIQAGHVGGTGFLMFVMAVGMARGRPATSAAAVPTQRNNTIPFYEWDFSVEGSR